MADPRACSNCGVALVPGVGFCAACGQALDTGTADPAPSQAPAEPTFGAAAPRDRRTGRTIVVIVVILLVIGAIATPLAFEAWYGISQSDSASTDEASWSPPAGYEIAVGTPDVAYRWLEDGDFACEITETCWGMSVIAHRGCPSMLYVALTIIDPAGGPGGFTNDLVAGVAPDQEVQMVFDNTELGPHEVSVKSVECL